MSCAADVDDIDVIHCEAADGRIMRLDWIELVIQCIQFQVKRPLLELKLVSDATYAQDMDFPRITTMEPGLRLRHPISWGNFEMVSCTIHFRSR